MLNGAEADKNRLSHLDSTKDLKSVSSGLTLGAKVRALGGISSADSLALSLPLSYMHTQKQGWEKV